MTDQMLQRTALPARDQTPPVVAVHSRAELHQPRGRLDTLDGIRTIAVMLVILFHVSVPGMEAGFLGVDVFFVLSGYLITTLLIREITASGRIDLARFWARRVLRLMPASLLVIAVVIAWGIVFAPAYQRPGLGADVLWSLLYVANWRFISSSSYFTNDGTQSPLQHVWSLAVEEQFYVGWPILLMLAALIFLRRAPQHEAPRGSTSGTGGGSASGVGGRSPAGAGSGAAVGAGTAVGGSGPGTFDMSQLADDQDRRAAAQRRLRRTAIVVGVLAAVQVVLSVVALWVLYDPAAPDRAYMGTDAKAFEPLIGAFAAAVMQTERARRFVIRYAELLMLAGLLGIVAGVRMMADAGGPTALYFEGGAFGFSILCALLVVGAAYTRDDFGIGRMLAWSPMAYLGRISYGIYLWHWPLAVWVGTHPQWRPREAAAVVVGTIVLAALSYHLYEHPLRTGKPAAVPPWRVLSAGGAAIMAIALSSGMLGGTPVSNVVPVLRTGPQQQTVVVVGDSVARRLVPALAQQGKPRDLTVLSAARGGCPALGVNVVDEDGRLVNNVDCAGDVPNLQREVVEQAHPSAVLWWSRYELADRQGPNGTVLRAGAPAFWDAQRAALKDTVDRLAATGALVVIVEVDRVGLGINTRCTPTTCPGFLRSLRDEDNLRQTWNQILRDYASTDGRVRLVTMDDVYCRNAVNPCNDQMPMRAPAAATAGTAPAVTSQAGPPQPGLWPPLGQFPVPDGSGYARPDGSHFRDDATPEVADILLDRLQAVLR